MSSKFGFSEDKIVKRKEPFPISNCVDDVELTNIEYEKGQFGPQVRMEFTRSKDNVSQVVMGWKKVPTLDQVKASPFRDETKSDDEVYGNQVKSFNTYMWHIAKQFNIDQDELESVVADSAEETIKNMCKLIMQNCKGVKLYMKTLRKKKTDWADIPKYPGFLQRMDEGECQLSYSESERKEVEKGSPDKAVKEKEDAEFTM